MIKAEAPIDSYAGVDGQDCAWIQGADQLDDRLVLLRHGQLGLGIRQGGFGQGNLRSGSGPVFNFS